MAHDKYTKGTIQQVVRQDENGQPLEAIERDTDGALWHVNGDKQTPIRADEVSSVVTEGTQRSSSKDDHR